MDKADCKPINGVCCEVDKCVHNNGCGSCIANDILVKTKMSMLGPQTECATFEQTDA